MKYEESSGFSCSVLHEVAVPLPHGARPGSVRRLPVGDRPRRTARVRRPASKCSSCAPRWSRSGFHGWAGRNPFGRCSVGQEFLVETREVGREPRRTHGSPPTRSCATTARGWTPAPRLPHRRHVGRRPRKTGNSTNEHLQYPPVGMDARAGRGGGGGKRGSCCEEALFPH